jgi:diacylglycerol kinase family enzyme
MEVHSDKTHIIYVQAKYITTSSLDREVTVTRDGEPIGILPVSFRIHKQILNIMASLLSLFKKLFQMVLKYRHCNT